MFYSKICDTFIKPSKNQWTTKIIIKLFADTILKIVALIETRLRKTRKYRLPVMYLIDSIVKEFPDEYINNFARNLVTFFADTFTNAWVKNYFLLIICKKNIVMPRDRQLGWYLPIRYDLN